MNTNKKTTSDPITETLQTSVVIMSSIGPMAMASKMMLLADSYGRMFSDATSMQNRNKALDRASLVSSGITAAEEQQNVRQQLKKVGK